MYAFCDNVINTFNGTVVFPSTGAAALSVLNGNIQATNHTDFPSCGVATYLRPVLGEAPPAWVIPIIYLVISSVNVAFRVKKFGGAQKFSMGLSFMTAFVVTLAYISTNFKSEMVMVWTPILLVGPAGSLLQVSVFMVEKHGLRLPGLKRFVRGNDIQGQRISLRPFPPASPTNRLHLDTLRVLESGLDSRAKRQHLKMDIRILATTVLLHLWIVVLQVVGIVFAFKGLQAQTPSVNWCSPVFFHQQAVLSSECDFYPITDDGPEGIGCISLPPILQRIWLLVTVISGSVSLLFEVLDLILLVKFNTVQKQPASWPGFGSLAKGSSSKWKRPWFTMISGLIAICVVFTLALCQAIYLPKGITSHVLVFGDSGSSSVCEAALTPSALRGEIIAWADGLLNSWGCTYYGCV